MSFKVTLNAGEDDELRGFLKQQIEGAVKSVTRAELKGMIYGVAEEKTRTGLTAKVEAEIRSLVRDAMGRYNVPHMIREAVREEVRAIVKEHVRLPGAIKLDVTPII
jgi:hypothetical protein